MLDLIWSTYRFWAAALAIVAMAGVWVIVERTRFGAMVKAGAHDSEIVQALGIDLARLCACGCSCSAPCWRHLPA